MLERDEALEHAVRLERAGYIDQAVEAFQRIAATSDEPGVVARALRHQADAYRILSQWKPAIELARRSAKAAKSAGLTILFAEALNAEAAVHQSRGAFDDAIPLLENILAVVDDDRIRGSALQNLGSIAAMNKDFATAQAHFEESMNSFRRAGYQRGEAIALGNAAAIANDVGDYPRAAELANEAIKLARGLHDYDTQAHASLNYARALIGLEDFDRAEEMLSTAFGFFTIGGNPYRQVAALRILGDLGRRQGKIENAARCYQHALGIARRIDATAEAEQLVERLADLGLTDPPPPLPTGLLPDHLPEP